MKQMGISLGIITFYTFVTLIHPMVLLIPFIEYNFNCEKLPPPLTPRHTLILNFFDLDDEL